MRRTQLVLAMALFLGVGMHAPAMAADLPSLTSDGVYEPTLKALFLLFALAVVLESGLALVFNWRPFVDVFDGRAVKPVISFIVAYIFVNAFSLDIVTSLVNVYQDGRFSSTTTGKVLTAMVIGGGSAAVNKMLENLNVRAAKAPSNTQRPPPSVAWISVWLDRKDAVGKVDVILEAKTVAGPQVVGTIKNTRWYHRIKWLFRDPGRFPPSGGFEVPPGDYSISLRGRDKAGNAIKTAVAWGPYYIPAGVVIDIELTL